jgi:hypothetical protein
VLHVAAHVQKVEAGHEGDSALDRKCVVLFAACIASARITTGRKLVASLVRNVALVFESSAQVREASMFLIDGPDIGFVASADICAIHGRTI